MGIRGAEILADADATRLASAVIATLKGSLTMTRLEGTKRALRAARTSLELYLNSVAKITSPS